MGDPAPAPARWEETGPPAGGQALRAVVYHVDAGAGQETIAALHLGWPGTAVRAVNSPGACLEAVRQLDPHLVAVETGAAGGQWLPLVRELRRLTGAVLVVIGQRESETDLIEAVEAGADEFFPPPLKRTVFVARVRAALRRARLAADQEAKVSYGGLEIDPERYEARVNGHHVNLSPTEFGLLLTLARRPERVLRHEALCQTIWGDSPNFCEATLRKHIENLRRKLAEAPGATAAIVTVPRVGYKLVTLEPPPPPQERAAI